jgi:hypothetical protein
MIFQWNLSIKLWPIINQLQKNTSVNHVQVKAEQNIRLKMPLFKIFIQNSG